MMLDGFREKIAGANFTGVNSFPMIFGSGPNGAIIHYRAPDENSSKLDINVPILCDTGAQYIQGTTDTTRTLHFKDKDQS